MIHLSFGLSNPWGRPFDNLWNRSGLITNHKAWEFSAYRTNHIINVDFNYRPVGDHAGVRIMLGLFGYDVELYFYDCRHWDHKTGTWELV